MSSYDLDPQIRGYVQQVITGQVSKYDRMFISVPAEYDHVLWTDHEGYINEGPRTEIYEITYIVRKIVDTRF